MFYCTVLGFTGFAQRTRVVITCLGAKLELMRNK